MPDKVPTIEIITEREKLAADTEQTVDVLVRIVPPAADGKAKRPRLNLSLVIDRSGSMQGRKIEEAKQAAKFCIDRLLATDRISTVIFDDEVDVLIPSQLVENKEMLKRAINSVQTDGSTALHEAWVRGGLQVSQHLNGDAVNRVLLITDGQANVGETRTDRMVLQAEQLAAKGVSTSTIGIGADFNEDLLMPMAEAGGGSAWHVQEPQDMVKIFDTELQGLFTQTGHSATLGIKPAAGVKVVDLLNDFETDSSGRYKLPNLQAGSPLEIVVRLKVPGNTGGTAGKIADFDIAYIGQDSKLPETAAGRFAATFAEAGLVSMLPQNDDVLDAVQMLINARARREAMELMDRFDYDGAQDILKCVAHSSEAAYARTSLPRFAEEAEDLSRQALALDDRNSDGRTRKEMAYRRENIRKSK